jgi:hypothetical protein
LPLLTRGLLTRPRCVHFPFSPVKLFLLSLKILGRKH